MMGTVPIVQIILSYAVMTLSCYGRDCSNCANTSVVCRYDTVLLWWGLFQLCNFSVVCRDDTVLL